MSKFEFQKTFISIIIMNKIYWDLESSKENEAHIESEIRET